MPLFSSRRKSEANLKASNGRAPTSPTAPAFPRVSEKTVKDAQARAPRSKSASRAGNGARPEREQATLPTGQARLAPAEVRARQSSGESSGGSGRVVLDGPAPALPLKDGRNGGATTPIAARYASAGRRGGYETPPRENSLATSATASSLSHLVSSPSFFASSPPTSDGGHDGFSLDASPPASFGGHQREQTPNSISQAFASSADLYASPSSSFIHSPPATNSYAQAAEAVVGLPTSTSFYNSRSPPRPPRRESLMRRNGNVSEPIHEMEDSPTVARAWAPARRADSASEGEVARPARRESLQAQPQGSPAAFASSPPPSLARRPIHRSPSASPSRLPPGAAPPAALSNSSFAASPSSRLASSTSSAQTTRAAYNPLAAFFGSASPNTSFTGSPAFTTSSAFTDGSPLIGQGSDAEGSAATPGTSIDGDHEDSSDGPLTPKDEKLLAEANKLQSPIRLPSVRLPPPPVLRDERTPTQGEFPRAPSAVGEGHRSRPSLDSQHAAPRQIEKAVPLPRSSSDQSRASSASPYKPTPRRESLPPTSPLRAIHAEARPQPSLEEATPTSPTVLSRRKASIDAAAQYVTHAPVPPGLSSEAEPPSTPPRKASLDASRPLPSASIQQPSIPSSQRPNGLVLAAASPSEAPPNALASPRTPRTPKSPRALPPPLDLSAISQTSPSRKRVTAEGTTRAAALVAARERERKVAEAALGVEAEQPQAAAVEPAHEEGPRDDEMAGAEEEEQEEEPQLHPRVELAFSLYAKLILQQLLVHISYDDLTSLRAVSRTLQRCIDVDGKELVLERFLGAQGYRSFATSTTTTTGGARIKRTYIHPSDTITLDLRDLFAFRAGLALSTDDYARLAASYSSAPTHFSPTSLKLARATTRAHNRVVLRLRLQASLPAKAFAPPAFPALAKAAQPVHKTGRAASLRVWVPTAEGGWMTDKEVVEAEREVWRSSGCWPQLRKGDVVTNVAVEAFGNVGKMLFDGKFLRDLSFAFDSVGHLPPWLNMLAFSPAYYHNIVVSSSSDPVMYLSLAPFLSSVRETLQLVSDRVSLSSPQGSYLVKKHVYRAGIKVKHGQLIGDVGGGGAGPGGIEVVHEDWVGQAVLETEGTAEHAALLVARVASAEPTPWRILRSKCRPGKLWLRPVLDSEAVPPPPTAAIPPRPLPAPSASASLAVPSSRPRPDSPASSLSLSRQNKHKRQRTQHPVPHATRAHPFPHQQALVQHPAASSSAATLDPSHANHMDDLSLSSSASYANSWISWFLASKGNEYFCEVDEEYIVDRFNLTGLNAEVQGYSAALDLITDTAADEDLNDEQREQLESSARHLYGLIHARYIITSRGLSKMIEKYKKGDFGRCPRVLCYGQPLLPLGLSDLAYQKAVKLYCPRCEDLYSPKSSRHGSIDGAYFGSTFAHMLFMVYPGMIPSKSVPGAGQGSGGQAGLGAGGLGAQAAQKVERVRPRIFGFQVHEQAKLLRWQERVRDQQIQRLEDFEREGQLD